MSQTVGSKQPTFAESHTSWDSAGMKWSCKHYLGKKHLQILWYKGTFAYEGEGGAGTPSDAEGSTLLSTPLGLPPVSGGVCSLRGKRAKLSDQATKHSGTAFQRMPPLVLFYFIDSLEMFFIVLWPRGACSKMILHSSNPVLGIAIKKKMPEDYSLFSLRGC